MKKLIIAAVITSAVSGTTLCRLRVKQSKKHQKKQPLAKSAGAVVGGLLGGPLARLWARLQAV